jgi:hypothetical protein
VSTALASTDGKNRIVDFKKGDRPADPLLPGQYSWLDRGLRAAIARDRRHRQHHRPFAALFSKAALVEALRQKRALLGGPMLMAESPWGGTKLTGSYLCL